jgi:hypothetical protein
LLGPLPAISVFLIVPVVMSITYCVYYLLKLSQNYSPFRRFIFP